MLPHSLIGQITYAIFDALSLFAIWKGDRFQRTAGLVLLLANTATSLIQDRVHWMDPEGRLFLEDCLLLAVLLGVALATGRVWAILAAAFQLLSTLSHPAAHFARHVGPVAYMTVVEFFGYGVYLTVALGVAFDLAVGRRGGPRRRPAIAAPPKA